VSYPILTKKGASQEGKGSREISISTFLKERKLNWLLVFVPISVALEFLALPRLWVFATSALAVIPLAGLICGATEELSCAVGPGLGGLLNATFGNATELIIAFFALQAGLQELVKASISGSIIGNILLVLGLSMFLGGWGRDRQTFNRTSAGANSAMLFLAAVALIMPAVFDFAIFGSLETTGLTIEDISLLVALVLIITYGASLFFSLKTHRHELTAAICRVEKARLSRSNSVVLLLLSTVVVTLESELLVGSVSAVMATLGLSEFFLGVVVIAVIGNAAEHTTAVASARKNNMELSVAIAVGSATQIALFVGPVLVFASLLFGNPMSFVFNAFEIVGIALSVVAVTFVSLDGESNWFEGLQLLSVYMILAIVFFFVP
jgi:Ca2+:H+ antiporter